MNRPAPALLAVLCLVLAACGKPAQAPSARKLRIAFVTDSSSNDWAAAREGCNRAVAGLPNVALDFQLLTDNTAASQKRIVDDLLARHTDGIAICPVDPATQADMLRDAARQTLLFTVKRDAPGSGRTCFVGDNLAGTAPASDALGQMTLFVMAKALTDGRSAIPPEGKILLQP